MYQHREPILVTRPAGWSVARDASCLPEINLIKVVQSSLAGVSNLNFKLKLAVGWAETSLNHVGTNVLLRL